VADFVTAVRATVKRLHADVAAAMLFVATELLLGLLATEAADVLLDRARGAITLVTLLLASVDPTVENLATDLVTLES